MSKGLGKLQREILGILSGTTKRQVYAGTGPLGTRELLHELQERGQLERLPKKVAMGATRRACDGLLSRGFVSGKYVSDCDNLGRVTIQWEANPITKPEA